MNAAAVLRLLRKTRQTCTLQRRSVVGSDPYGEPTYGAWTTLATGVVCAYWVAGARGEQRAREGETIEYVPKLIVPYATDVTEGDRVSAVQHPSGVVSANPLDIRQLSGVAPLYKLLVCEEER